MKFRSTRYALLAGLILILLSNGVALFGVAQNRSGEPESQLELSQRELSRPYRGFDRENGGLALSLNWRTVDGNPKGVTLYYLGRGFPAWLDKAKMESLGFATSQATAGRTARDEVFHSSREVLLVLEMDGPAYRSVVERAQRHADEEAAKFAAAPEAKNARNLVDEARSHLKREENESSRLFVVDAGLERAELRAQYPDRRRYAIVRGQIQANRGAASSSPAGWIKQLSVSKINVPHEFRAWFERVKASQATEFDATVAFGQNLEPWISQLGGP